MKGGIDTGGGAGGLDTGAEGLVTDARAKVTGASAIVVNNKADAGVVDSGAASAIELETETGARGGALGNFSVGGEGFKLINRSVYFRPVSVNLFC